MSDRQEIIKVLAEKVMGLEVYVHQHHEDKLTVWNEKHTQVITFDPFDTKRTDNDALIEAFVGKHKGGWVEVYSQNGYIEVEAVLRYGEEKRTVTAEGHTTAKKNEAVCMAIYEAVSQ